MHAEALLLRFFLKFRTTSKTSAELQQDRQYHFHAPSRYLLDHKSTIDSSHMKQSKALLIFFFFNNLVSPASLGVCIAFRHPLSKCFIRSRRYMFHKRERGRKTLTLNFNPSTLRCWRILKADRDTFLTFSTCFLKRLCISLNQINLE